MIDGLKTCRLCLRELSQSMFPVMRDRRKKEPYLYYRCYDCHRTKNKEYNRANYVPSKRHDDEYKAMRKGQIKKYIRLYMRKRRRNMRKVEYAKFEELYISGSLSLSEDWVDEWTIRANESNAKLAEKYK